MIFDKNIYREKFKWIRENSPMTMQQMAQGMGVSEFLLRRFLTTEKPLRQYSMVKIKQWIEKKEKAIKEQL